MNFINNRIFNKIIFLMIILLSFQTLNVFAKNELDFIKILNASTIYEKNNRDEIVELLSGKDKQENQHKTIEINVDNKDNVLDTVFSYVYEQKGIDKNKLSGALNSFIDFQKDNQAMADVILNKYLRGFYYIDDNYDINNGFEDIIKIIEKDYYSYLVLIDFINDAKRIYNEPREIKIYNYLFVNSNGEIAFYKDFERIWKESSKIGNYILLKDFYGRFTRLLDIINTDNYITQRDNFIKNLEKNRLIDRYKRTKDGYVSDETLEMLGFSVKKSFSDIDSVQWAKEYIETLASEGVLSGVGEGTFAPNNNVKREEFAKMLVGAFGLKDESAATQLSDVGKDKWYYSFVSIAEKLKIVNGIGDNKFGVGSNITRQDMAVMAYRAAKAANKTINKSKEAQKFKDETNIADYANESVSLMQQAGIINGMEDGRFAPSENATRAQAAKIIYMLTRR